MIYMQLRGGRVHLQFNSLASRSSQSEVMPIFVLGVAHGFLHLIGLECVDNGLSGLTRGIHNVGRVLDKFLWPLCMNGGPCVGFGCAHT